MPSTLGFVRQFLHPRDGAVLMEETGYVRNDVALPARTYRPAGATRPLPAWVVLHGLTRTGREHRGLDGFARAFAAAGNLVFVPDIPEWRELRVAPAITADTIRVAVRTVQQREDVRHGHVGLLAFSFGATQAIMAGADPELAELLHGIVAWGGYNDLHTPIRFGLTGVMDAGRERRRVEPDPYGVWVIAGNYLPHVPGYEDCTDVAAALHALAQEAGQRGVYAWDPVYDASKLRLRETLPAEKRELFDYLAPPTHVPRRDEPRATELAAALGDAALRVDPLLDPTPRLPQLRVPVLVAHGRDDRLIPYPESLRLYDRLPRPYRRGCTVTGLFAHSGGTLGGLGPLVRTREAARFLWLMRRIIALV